MPTLLGSLARGAFLRRRARPEAWGGSSGRQTGVEYHPSVARIHAPEHWDSASGRSELAVGLNTNDTRHRSGALVLEHGAPVRRWGASGLAAMVHGCPCKKIQCSARRPAHIQGSRGARCLAPTRRRGSTNGRPVPAMRKQGPSVGRWGALGPGLTRSPQEEEHHGSKAGTPERKARRDARRRVEGCPSVQRTEVQQGAKLPRAPDIAAWGSHSVGSP
jgi:hypothetical protein